MPFHGKEMQNNNKNNRKVTKLPTAKLIEIAVANCKKLSQFRDRVYVLKHCQYFQIENYIYEIGKSAICWLGSVMNHATRNRKRRKIFVISGKNLSINKR